MKLMNNKQVLTIILVGLWSTVFIDPVFGCGGGGGAGTPTGSNNYIEVGGEYDMSDPSAHPTFWPAGNTYYIYDTLILKNGTLVIEPGAIVKFNTNMALDTSQGGVLIAKGEPYGQ